MNLVAKEKSWILGLANFPETVFYSGDRADFCSIFWESVKGLVFACVFVVTGSFFGLVLLVDPLSWVVASLVVGLWIAPQALAVIGLTIWALLLAAVAGALVYFKVNQMDVLEKSPSLRVIRAGYRGWKEKTCVLVDIA